MGSTQNKKTKSEETSANLWKQFDPRVTLGICAVLAIALPYAGIILSLGVALYGHNQKHYLARNIASALVVVGIVSILFGIGPFQAGGIL